MKKIVKSIAVAMALAALGGCVETAEGEKIGMITKIAKQGLVCPTWEAEIVRGGFNGGNGVNGQAFHFTVADEESAKKIRAAMESQKEVKITYRAELASVCRSDSNSTFMTSFEVIERKEPVPAPSPAAGTQAPAAGTSPTIRRLLEVQAELLKELAAGK